MAIDLGAIDEEGVRSILEEKHDVWHNPHLFQLVKEFLDLCNALDNFIKASSGELTPPDCEKLKKLVEKLVEKKRKLDKKLKRVKVWKKVSTIMFGSLVAVLLMGSVVAAAIAAPPIATAMAATSSLPLQSMGTWVNSLWNGYEKELTIQKELVEDLHKGTHVAIKDLVAVQRMLEDISKTRDAFLTEFDECRTRIVQARRSVLQWIIGRSE